MAFPEDLKLELAWKRLKYDRPDRIFVNHPHQIRVIDANLPIWLRRIREQLTRGYLPSSSSICYVPKPNWLVRPGSVLTLEDEVVYNALIGSEYAKIYQAIKWSQGVADIAYRMSSNASRIDWIKRDFHIWREWRQKSIAAIEAGAQFVLTTDVAGFYENIDFSRLKSDLSHTGITIPVADLILALLTKWAMPCKKGIPQGYSASDILAKLYLDPVDRGMRASGFVHLRYVDDFRVFCNSQKEAKQALLHLNDLLRSKGLILQSAKTKILTVDEARREIDGVESRIQAIGTTLAKELTELGGVQKYASVKEIDRAMQRNQIDVRIEVLEKAFKDFFLSQSVIGFDKTLFHFLLVRLGHAKSQFAIPYCIRALADRPDETQYLCRYFAHFLDSEDVINSVLDTLDSPEIIHDYQKYQLVKWLYDYRVFPQRLVPICRRLWSDRNGASWLRSYSLAVVSIMADSSDFDLIESRYQIAASDLERCEAILAFSSAELGRRNSFFSRVRTDGFFTELAAKYVLSQTPQPRVVVLPSEDTEFEITD